MTDETLMRSAIQRIATGPTMSKDLPRPEARDAMRQILSGNADPVQAGIFLIALRMKRETDDELAGVLDAIVDGMRVTPIDLPRLLVLVDPYDGSMRSTPGGAFLPAVMAACGVATLSHGQHEMGPKFGTTHQQVLAAAGIQALAGTDQATAALTDPDCGWAYLPQALIAPELNALAGLRTLIVKRPCLTTIESVLCPYRPSGSLHLATGFVHKAYPPIYAHLAREAGFDSAVLIRGVEGSVVPSLSQSARYFLTTADGQSRQVDIEPAEAGLQHEERAVPLPLELQGDDVALSVKVPGNEFAQALAPHAACLGRAALQGEPGPMRDSLVYAAGVMLAGLFPTKTLAEHVPTVQASIDSGEALKRFEAMG